jgi:hypothetical protein
VFRCLSLLNMIRNFNAQIGGVEFEFVTQHVVKLYGFQVYVVHDEQKVRFHMQINKEGSFYITDRNSCPEAYLPFEISLSDAILNSNKKAE